MRAEHQKRNDDEARLAIVQQQVRQTTRERDKLRTSLQACEDTILQLKKAAIESDRQRLSLESRLEHVMKG